MERFGGHDVFTTKLRGDRRLGNFCIIEPIVSLETPIS
jgi:hypothetical protein